MDPLHEKHRDQVSYYVDLEGKIQDILDLGGKGGHFGGLAYGPDIFNAIYNPMKEGQMIKLHAVPGKKYSRREGRKRLYKAGKPEFDCKQLFANPTNKHYHGCLKFVKMSVYERRTVSFKASL